MTPIDPGRDIHLPHPARRLGIVAILAVTLCSACHKTASTAPTETPTQSGDSVQGPDATAAAKSAEAAELRQKVAEARKLAASGSCDEAAARLLKLRVENAKFSDKDAAAYREAFQDTYSRALEAAGKGDPKGQAALEMIRAARGR